MKRNPPKINFDIVEGIPEYEFITTLLEYAKKGDFESIKIIRYALEKRIEVIEDREK